MLVAEGNLTEALQAYRDSFAIFERLAKADPSNAGWQRDLAVSYGKLASAYLRLNNAAEALAALRKGRDVMVALVTISPSNTQWKEDLTRFDDEIAKLEGRSQEAGKN